MKHKFLEISSIVYMLQNSPNSLFSLEVVESILNDVIIVYPVASLERDIAYRIYYTRRKISQEKHDDVIDGYDELLHAIQTSDDLEIYAVTIVKKNCGYLIFYNDHLDILSIIKSIKMNTADIVELENSYRNAGINTEIRVYDRTLPISVFDL